MTHQRDPHRRRPQDYIRREDGSFSLLAIGAVAVMAALLLYLAFGPSTEPAPSRAVTGENAGAPTAGNVPPPAPGPTTPKQ